MMAKIDDYTRGGIEADTLLAALAKARVLKVTKNADGSFELEERCDGYFGVRLTRDQVLALAEELRALADCGKAPDCGKVEGR
jgi:hypothetical protein